MNLASEIAGGLVHLFFPEICPGCGGDLPKREQLICLKCQHSLPKTGFEQYANNPIEKIFWGRVTLSTASAHFYFSKHSPLQHILHQLKYGGKKAIGEYFGKSMGIAIGETGRFGKIDALLPLPLFASRQRVRGFNQATALCGGIADVLELPILEHAITRTSATETQTHKSRIGRWQNMEGKFQLQHENELEHKHVLLVDDVITTGATLDACAQELLKVKGICLSIAALAFTLP
jgi:ComF family protein